VKQDAPIQKKKIRKEKKNKRKIKEKIITSEWVIFGTPLKMGEAQLTLEEMIVCPPAGAINASALLFPNKPIKNISISNN